MYGRQPIVSGTKYEVLCGQVDLDPLRPMQPALVTKLDGNKLGRRYMVGNLSQYLQPIAYNNTNRYLCRVCNSIGAKHILALRDRFQSKTGT